MINKAFAMVLFDHIKDFRAREVSFIGKVQNNNGRELTLADQNGKF